MGYYTRFKLEITPKYTAEEELAFTEDIAGFFGMKDQVTIKTHFEDFLEEEMKWYDYEEDMLKLSKKHPKFLFTLSGEGEESGDIWVNYFKNGKSQRADAEITFEKCKLK